VVAKIDGETSEKPKVPEPILAVNVAKASNLSTKNPGVYEKNESYAY
jgi:hypothetical protein